MYFQQQLSGRSTAVSVQQGSMMWNGREWVPSSASTTSGYSSYTYAQQPSPQKSTPLLAPNTNISNQSFQSPVSSQQQLQKAIEQYTSYQEHWSSQAVAQRQKAGSLPPGPEKDEALRVAAWAEHYAQQSTQAANYYRSSATALQQSTPAMAAAVAVNSMQTPKPMEKSDAENQYPPSLQRFTQRAISQCTTNEQRKHVQESVEKVVAEAIKTNSLFTVDWDSKPLPEIQKNVRENKADSFSSSTSFGVSSLSSSLSLQVPSKNRHSPASPTSKLAKPQAEAKFSAFSINAVSSLNKRKHSKPDKALQPKESKKKKKPLIDETEYLQLMPENDSYYGHVTDTQSQAQNNVSSKKMIQKDQNQIKKVQKQAKQVNTNPKNLKRSESSSSEGFERSYTVLARRADRFSGKGGLDASSTVVNSTEKFGQYMGISVIRGSAPSRRLSESDYEYMTVKGTCEKLEKEYLRLTAPPRAEAVRPKPILEQHLKNLKRKYSASECEYSWLCSQLKAIRQDLTVQRIENAFSVDVYEMHARVALENMDLNEYNQCQTQLKELYANLERKNLKGSKGLQNQNEFIAYRIIYYVFLTGNKKYEGGSTDLFKIMLNLSSLQRKDPCISHALKVRVAVAENDYHAFFRLHDNCPLMGAYLMDAMVPTMRLSALQRICKAYRPSVSVKHVLSELGFDVASGKEIVSGKKWLESCGGVASNEGELLTKESNITNSLDEQKNSLI